MKFGNFEITTWDAQERKIIWFEYLNGFCGCKFLTILNILFAYYSPKCLNQELPND